MPNAQEIYTTTVRILPPEERLRLAALILNELTQADTSAAEAALTWSDGDMHDLLVFSMKHAEASYPEEEDLV
jgi:hypothetical protein